MSYDFLHNFLKDDVTLHIELKKHKKGDSYPQHDFYWVNKYFDYRKEQNKYSEGVASSNEHIRNTIDRLMADNPDKEEYTYAYFILKEWKQKHSRKSIWV